MRQITYPSISESSVLLARTQNIWLERTVW